MGDALRAGRTVTVKDESGGAHVGGVVARSDTPVTRMERRRAIRRRRSRLVWLVCGAFCLLVLATSFPVQALIRQHDSITYSSAELARLTAGNNALQQQATELLNPANIAALARSDYDMVSPGEKAYEVLPSGGSSQSSSTGHSLLDEGPVAPGSVVSQDLLGDTGSGTAAGSGSGSKAPGSKASGSVGSGSGGNQGKTPGLWGRVLNTLEFWS